MYAVDVHVAHPEKQEAHIIPPNGLPTNPREQALHDVTVFDGSVHTLQAKLHG